MCPWVQKLSIQQEASSDGILVVDVDGKVISSNQRFADMWGIAPVIVNSRFEESIELVMTKH